MITTRDKIKKLLIYKDRLSELKLDSDCNAIFKQIFDLIDEKKILGKTPIAIIMNKQIFDFFSEHALKSQMLREFSDKDGKNCFIIAGIQVFKCEFLLKQIVIGCLEDVDLKNQKLKISDFNNKEYAFKIHIDEVRKLSEKFKNSNLNRKEVENENR